MKDYEIRDLINELTTVAQVYGQSPELRDQIAQILVPVLKPEKSNVVPIRNDLSYL